MHKLSAIQAAKAIVPGMYHDGGGLYLQVTGPTSRSWLYRYTLNGKARALGLGSANAIPLKRARELAAEARRLRAEGVDPIEHRNAARKGKQLEAARTMTFEQCAEAYISAHRASWKNDKHAAQWPSSLKTYAYPLLGSLPVQSIDTGLVVKVLQPIWTTKSETANRLRGRIESVLDWAKVSGYRDGENPARWRGHLQKALPAQAKIKKRKHHAAMPYAEIPAFMIELRKRENIGDRCLEFTILTAARTSESIGAQWTEIDFDEAIWTVPAERMKGGREHRVALSTRALDILRELYAKRENAFVFPGARIGKPLSNMAMLKTLAVMGHGDLTTHGFRSTFKDWAREKTNFANEVSEAALAHIVGDKTEAAYARGDMLEKRCKLMEAWADYCRTAPAAGKVLSFPAVG